MEEIIGRRVFGLVREGGESDHFTLCPCGQLLDMRRLNRLAEHLKTCPAASGGAGDQPGV